MNKEIDFETNLIISNRKFEIFLLDIKNYKNIYQEEFEFQDVSEKIDFNLRDDQKRDEIRLHGHKTVQKFMPRNWATQIRKIT